MIFPAIIETHSTSLAFIVVFLQSTCPRQLTTCFFFRLVQACSNSLVWLKLFLLTYNNFFPIAVPPIINILTHHQCFSKSTNAFRFNSSIISFKNSLPVTVPSEVMLLSPSSYYSLHDRPIYWRTCCWDKGERLYSESHLTEKMME